MSKKQPKKNQRTENQHYVPQFYLRGFTNPAGRMFCFDKVSGKSHPTTTQAAAQEPYFYEIPPGSFRDFNVPVNTVEKALCVVEKTWAPLHAELIKHADVGLYWFSENRKFAFGALACFQGLRASLIMFRC